MGLGGRCNQRWPWRPLGEFLNEGGVADWSSCRTIMITYFTRMCIAQNTDNVIFVMEKNIYALQMKRRWEFNLNVWFPFMHSQKWNCAASLFPKQNYNVLSPNSYTHISVRDLYISRIGLSTVFCCSQICGVDWSWEYINLSLTHECGNWDWGRAIPKKGIHKWDFRCSVANF